MTSADALADSPAHAVRPATVTLIAAVCRNGVIGRGAELVFRDAKDAQHFKHATLGKPVIMGRKTWESLPARFRPLPGRRNLVVSRHSGYTAPGAEVLGSLEAALAAVADAPEAMVMGGGELYAQALPLASRLVLTEVDAAPDGDVFFPPWPREDFERVSQLPHAAADGTSFCINTYQRLPVGLLAELTCLERELHHPGVRSSAERLSELLHPAFHEVGRSGRRYDRATCLRFLLQDAAPPDVLSDTYTLQRIADDQALLSYRSALRGPQGLQLHTWRASLWQRGAAGWQLRYHQGTPAAEPW
jgi:dihydrofolate reductase